MGTKSTQVLQPATEKPGERARLRYVSAGQAGSIDEALMSDRYGHTLEQLMELAGLSVACAVADTTRHTTTTRVAVVCGPGNNGGDGLVAARHLHHFGYAGVTVVYPKRSGRAPFPKLVTQLEACNIPIVDDVPEDAQFLVDSIFGFSFDGSRGVRPPFDTIFRQLNEAEAPLLAVDVPSGWHVDDGNIYKDAVRTPDALISLTVPKRFAATLDDNNELVHYVGGRFVPKSLCDEFDFSVPPYPGSQQITRIS